MGPLRFPQPPPLKRSLYGGPWPLPGVHGPYNCAYRAAQVRTSVPPSLSWFRENCGFGSDYYRKQKTAVNRRLLAIHELKVEDEQAGI